MPTKLTTQVYAVRLSGPSLTHFAAYCDANALSPSDALREFLEAGLKMGGAPQGRRTAAEVRRVMQAIAQRIGDLTVEIGERTNWQPEAMLKQVDQIGRTGPVPRRAG